MLGDCRRAAHNVLMFRPVSRHWLALGGVLLATFVAAVWPSGEESSTLEAGGPSAQGDGLKLRIDLSLIDEPKLPVLGERLERARGATKVENLFVASSWNPPPSPSKRRTPAPVAPRSAPA